MVKTNKLNHIKKFTRTRPLEVVNLYKKIQELYFKDISVQEIMKVLNCSISQCYAALRDYISLKKNAELRAFKRLIQVERVSICEAAHELNIGVVKAYKLARKHNLTSKKSKASMRKAKENNIDRVRYLLGTGMHVNEMAKLIGVTVTSVRGYIKEIKKDNATTN